MTALDRYDDWAEGLADLLDDDRADDALAGVYDPQTLLAIDAHQGEPHQRGADRAAAGGWRGSATAGALVVGIVRGVGDVLDDDTEPVEEIDHGIRDARLEPVSVHLAWGNPAASVAIVRRWLL